MTTTVTTTRTIMFVFCSLIIVGCFITAVMLAPTTYDQRQSGDLNVQVELKDVRVVALLNSEFLEDYTDYDYFYDYADFTIKPSDRPTTISTTEVTEVNDIMNVTQSVLSLNSTISELSVNTTNSASSNPEILNANPLNNATNSITNLTSNIDDNDKNQLNEEDKSESHIFASSALLTTVKPAVRSKKRCKSGYVPNGNGRCRRSNRRWLSLLP